MAPFTMSSFLLTIVILFTMTILTIVGNSVPMPPYPGESDLIIHLPGQPIEAKFKQYAGYVSINEDSAMFYWFIQATDEPMNKPLVLWLNGGPGCSSVAGGCIKEIGPFLVTNDGSRLRFNDYSWNRVANLLFLESPVGVGFSYSNKTLETFNDQLTAEDSYTFLINWFAKFPMFKSHEFYIAGESYGGHYAPQLAYLIHEKNKMANENFIKLKGILLGNALLDWVQNYNSAAKFAWNNGIISHKLYRYYTSECDPHPKDNSVKSWNGTCDEAIDAIAAAYKRLDFYHIYAPICTDSSSKTAESGLPKTDSSIEFDPCAKFIMDVYLNRPDVQKALHANVTGLPYPFKSCNTTINKLYPKFDVATIVPELHKLLNASYRVWIFSGDVDGIITMDATRTTVMDMRLTEKPWDEWGGWRKWYYDGQLAGWMVEYTEGLTFVTVRGVGHMVPIYTPGRSLEIFTRFLSGEALTAEDAKGE